ncbi:MAG: topoisomerase C-terminal repeat-containing protein, partial [Pirellulales bacterium]
IYVRVGRFGPFLEQGERRASIPDGFPPDELTIRAALEMLDRASQGDEPLGVCPETKKAVFLKVGRFGPYVQRGTSQDEEKPQNASLLKSMDPEDVDLATALKLLSLPRELGEHPDGSSPLAGQKVWAHNGRFGPYVKCGDETRSLPSELSPLDITLEQAVALLAEPKKARRGFGAPKEPIKVFSQSPVTAEPVKLLEGRYGPYVTDGATNASLPKGTPVEELTFEQALELLAARAAQGPARKGSRRKKSPSRKSSPAKKKAAPRKTARSKAKGSRPKAKGRKAAKSAE